MPQIFESLTECHRVLGLPKPLHPLISFINIEDLKISPDDLSNSFSTKFYKISYKEGKNIKYGQDYFDFGEGGMVFSSPNQIFEKPDENPQKALILLIHPDFFLSYSLAKSIKQYGFFSYATNEALHLSENEKEVIFSIFKLIENEIKNRIDDFSQDVIISQIELLLNYSNRFYNRQFITRKAVNNSLLQQIDEILEDYFNSTKAINGGIPTVQFLAKQLNTSPSYLSDMLRSLTGQNAQQHIREKLIEKAKEKLSTTELSISEIAYELGFGHLQSFSKMFKSKVGQSPLEFRVKFN